MTETPDTRPVKASDRLGTPKDIVILLGVLAGAALVLQVVRASATASKTETALFGVLQFVFSIAFAWLLTRVSAKREFEESQRQFAIAAYRRIREIDSGVERLLVRLRNQLPTASEETARELEVVMAIAIGIRSSTKSSIADWGDIIGEEIVTVERIANIRSEQEGFVEFPTDSRKSRARLPKESAISLQRLEASQKRVETLLESLPYSLRILESEETPVEVSITSEAARIESELKAQGFTDLRGYCDEGFPRHPRQDEIGSEIVIRLSDVSGRVGILTAYASDVPIGVILNTTEGDYRSCLEVMARVFNATSVTGTLVSIDVHEQTNTCHFTVRVTRDSIRPDPEPAEIEDAT